MLLDTLGALASSPLPQFRIRAVGPVSLLFLDAGIHTFHDALHYVRHLPYERTTDAKDLSKVFGEARGTCSTKHTLLASLAEESGYDVRLMLGIFPMNGSLSPGVGTVLAEAGLDYVPEAHCYLMWEGQRYDFTASLADPVLFETVLLHEQELVPENAPAVKKNIHREFLKTWLEEQHSTSLSFDGLWAAREACVAALAAGGASGKRPFEAVAG